MCIRDRKYTITVRTGYNPSRLQEDGFQVYTVKKDLHEIGIIAMQDVYKRQPAVCIAVLIMYWMGYILIFTR